jgi:hypothetical protein
MMKKVYNFDATIRKVEDIDGAYIEFPYDVKTEFGTSGRVKVVALFDGVEYRGSLVKMKTPCHIIGISKEIRAQIGKQAGDMIAVELWADLENKVSELPENLESALAREKEAKEFFNSLTSSQKNKFITFITSAKKQETADARLEKVIQMLKNKEKMK